MVSNRQSICPPMITLAIDARPADPGPVPSAIGIIEATSIIVVTAIIVLVQLVAMGTLPELAAATTPLADAFGLFAALLALAVGAMYFLVRDEPVIAAPRSLVSKQGPIQ